MHGVEANNMQTLPHFRNNEELDSFLQVEGAALAKDAAKYLKAASLQSAILTAGEPRIVSNPSKNTDGYLASILFMGPVFGEFILFVERKVAEELFSPLTEGTSSEARSQIICEALAETLNLCAGRRMVYFNQVFKKMTMSVPKVSLGQVMYRSIRSSITQIESDFGAIDSAIYIDQMKTDLADAHIDMIAQLKAANSDLESVNKRLQEQQTQLVQSEKMASLGIMAAGVAHEINNPLSFVMANIETLSEYVEVTTRLIGSYSVFMKHLVENDRKENRSEIEKIRSIEEKEEITYITEDSQKLIEESRGGLDRIRRIVSGLKRFSRQEVDAFRPVQINEEILNTLELLRNELKYRCKIETDLQAKREIRCLPGELSQVFMNIMINAAQAMPESGGTIFVETREEAESLLIRFRDTGAGMSREVLEKIFQPFFTTKPVGKGTGLGLAISFGIVERHGGKITVESTLGLGSTFTIRLPY